MEALMDSLCPFRKKPNLKVIFIIFQVVDQGMPVVMFDRVTNEILCDKVIIDDKLAYEAVQSLIDKGRKKIALVTTVDYVV
jgi:LacI family transcriptional regulator